MASSLVRPHVPEEELHGYCDGELSPSQRVEIAEHLLGCLICRAQHAEVEVIRARTRELLAIAIPNGSRRAGTPADIRRATNRRQWPRMATAVAAALVGVGVWFSLKPEATSETNAQLAMLGTSSLPRLGAAGLDTAGSQSKQSVMLERLGSTPRVTVAPDAGPFARAAVIGTPTLVDPVITTDWPVTTFDSALKIGHGSLARVDSVSVAAVRMHPSAIGGRPTFMVRQQLADGRPFWIFEGLDEDITPVNQLLQASGITMSTVTRTRGEYVGVGADLQITTRLVTVVGYLPVDSLNILVSKVKLR